MKQVLARTGNAYFDSFLENKEEEIEEEDTEKDEKEEEETTGNAYFDSFLKPTEEETVETSTDETPTPMKFLYQKATDEDYAYKTYGEAVGAKEIKTYKEFTQDKQFLNTANEYMIARFGEKAGQQEGETDEEFTDRFIEHYRNVTTNTLDLMGQVDWTRTANEKDKANYGALFRDMERLPSFYEEGGTSTFDAIMDYGAALLTDPLTYLGFGAGAVAKVGATSAAKKLFLETAKAGVKSGMTKKAAQEAAKAEVKRQSRKLGLKASAKPLALETAAGVGEGYYHIGAASELDVEAHKREEKAGFGEKALGGLLFGTVVGGIGGVSALGVGKLGVQGMERSFKLQAQAKESVLKKQREAARAKNAPDSTEVADAFDPIKATNWDESVARGKEILEELDPSTDLTSASLQPDLLKRVTKVAKEALKDLKDSDRDKFFEFSKAYLGQKKRASLALRDVLQGLAKETEAGAIDEVVLEGAIKRAGLSTEQFAKLAFNADTIPATTSKGGQSLGIVSGFKRAFDVLKDTDPRLQKLFEEKFGKENPTTNIMGAAHDFMMRLDRERRALMVTQLATTVRNVGTGIMRLGFEGGANLIESAIYNLGRGTKEFITTGKIDKDAVWKASKDMINDSFGTLINVVQFGEAKDITEELLKFDPAILRQIDRSLQEVGADQTLSSITRKLNTLNMAQDKLFRRAVFTSTLDKQLRRMGTNVREVIASGKTLPTKMLQNAMEESLAFTFARMPKAGGDKPLDSLGSIFVKVNEKLGSSLPGFVGVPLGTGAFPYARFMVNALQFNLQYQPGSAVAGAINGVRGLINIGKQDKSLKELGGRQLQKFREQMSRGLIGSAAFYAAYKYRLEHQEDGTKWYEAKADDGRTVDLRPMFPLAPYLLVGEVMVQLKNKVQGKPDKLDASEIIEGFTGATFRTGAGAYMIDNIFQSLGSEEGAGGLNGEKIAEYMGGYLGELVGGGFTPLKVLTDIEAAFDIEAAYVRDSRQLEEFGAMRGVEAFKNAASRNLPFLGGLTDKFGQAVFGKDLSAQSLPIAESATRDAPMVKQSTLGAQLTGVRKESVRNTLEKELANFNIKNYEVVPTTGDKKADAFIKARLGKFVERGLHKRVRKHVLSEVRWF